MIASSVFLVGLYFFWRCYLRHDSVPDAFLFPIRWFCDKTGIWKPVPPPPTPIEVEEHRRRHVELHRCLDELYADWLRHNMGPNIPFRGMDTVTIGELVRWSHGQTKEPTE